MTEKPVLQFELRYKLLHLVDTYYEVSQRNAARSAVLKSDAEALFSVQDTLAFWTKSDDKQAAICKELEDWLMKTLE